MPLPSRLGRCARIKMGNCVIFATHEKHMKASFQSLILLLFLILNQQIHGQRIMITPEYLKKGDTVGILATARKIDMATLQPAISLLESWGLHVVIGRSIG